MEEMEFELPCTTTLTICSKNPLCSRTDRFNLVYEQLNSKHNITSSDPNYVELRTRDMQKLLQDVQQYEEAKMLTTVIAVIKKGLVKMERSDRPLNFEITELRKLRKELKKHLRDRESMPEETRKICQQLTGTPENQILRLEIQMRRKVWLVARRR